MQSAQECWLSWLTTACDPPSDPPREGAGIDRDRAWSMQHSHASMKAPGRQSQRPLPDGLSPPRCLVDPHKHGMSTALHKQLLSKGAQTIAAQGFIDSTDDALLSIAGAETRHAAAAGAVTVFTPAEVPKQTLASACTQPACRSCSCRGTSRSPVTFSLAAPVAVYLMLQHGKINTPPPSSSSSSSSSSSHHSNGSNVRDAHSVCQPRHLLTCPSYIGFTEAALAVSPSSTPSGRSRRSFSMRMLELRLAM